ncbi:MAG: PAS domain S-box protein [Pseudomonadota bacterium]
MNIDIRTLAIVLGIISVLQVIAFFLQYMTHKSYRGIGWWLLWSALTALGFTAMLLRDIVSLELMTISIFLTNILLLAGQIFLYIGVMRFLDKKENRGIIISIFAVFILPTFYVIYVNRDDNARAMILYFAVAVISFLAAQCLFVHKTRSISASANFLSVVFLAHGSYFAFRLLEALTSVPVDKVFAPTLMQTATFLVPLIASYLWAFGLIIMNNQRSIAEMSEAKEHFELIFNTGPDAVLITRLHDGCFVGINDGFTALTGFTRTEVIGKSSLDINIWKNPVDRQKIVTMLNEKGFYENLEVVFQRKDGSQIIGLLSAKLIILQGLPHIISVTRDITDRKRTEAALQKSEEKFRLLVENSHDIIYSLTADGVFIFVSPVWTTLLGHSVIQVVGTSFQTFVHPDDIPGCMVFLQAVIDTGQRQEGIEYRVQHTDGSWYWHTSSAVPFKDESGSIVGFYGIAKDITERKKKEDDMKELISQLQKAIEEIKTLKGIVPICANCKKIRDDKGYWEQVESYVSKHTEAQFSHSICPECLKEHYPEYC